MSQCEISQNEISIHGPVFEEIANQIDAGLRRCLQEIAAGNFDDGVITATIGVSLVEDYEEFPIINKSGEPDKEAYIYQRPVFEHKVAVALKKQAVVKGRAENRGMELKRAGDDTYYLKPVIKAQLTLDDEGGA